MLRRSKKATAGTVVTVFASRLTPACRQAGLEDLKRIYNLTLNFYQSQLFDGAANSILHFQSIKFKVVEHEI